VLLFPALAQATAWQAGQQSKKLRNKKIKISVDAVPASRLEVAAQLKNSIKNSIYEKEIRFTIRLF
jgi:hypothetical protein